MIAVSWFNQKFKPCNIVLLLIRHEGIRQTHSRILEKTQTDKCWIKDYWLIRQGRGVKVQVVLNELANIKCIIIYYFF